VAARRREGRCGDRVWPHIRDQLSDSQKLVAYCRPTWMSLQLQQRDAQNLPRSATVEQSRRLGLDQHACTYRQPMAAEGKDAPLPAE
jgi:hypothetical protein